MYMCLTSISSMGISLLLVLHQKLRCFTDAILKIPLPPQLSSKTWSQATCAFLLSLLMNGLKTRLVLREKIFVVNFHGLGSNKALRIFAWLHEVSGLPLKTWERPCAYEWIQGTMGF